MRFEPTSTGPVYKGEKTCTGSLTAGFVFKGLIFPSDDHEYKSTPLDSGFYIISSHGGSNHCVNLVTGIRWTAGRVIVEERDNLQLRLRG